MLEAESLALNEKRSEPMTVKQRDKVSKLGQSGWEIRKREEDKVVMQKGDKELFVYTSGKTFAITEGREEDVTELMDALLEGDGVLEEGVLQNLINKFKSTKPKMTIYSNGRNGAIAIARSNGTTSIYHTENGEVVFENSTISDQALSDHIETYEQKGYQKIRNRATLYRVLGLIAGSGAIALGAGVMAAVGFRLITGLMALYEDTQASQVGANADQVEEVKNEVMTKIDSAVQMSGDTLTIDPEALDASIEAVDGSSFTLMSVLIDSNKFMWGAFAGGIGAVFGGALWFLKYSSHKAGEAVFGKSTASSLADLT